jgi:glycosyltransferase involved in cell wall biosynthesis
MQVTNGQEPCISVIVPVHNMAGKLGNLEKTLKQSRELELQIEFLLIQDGMDFDTTRELQDLSKKYSAQYLQVNFHSPGLTRNSGLAHVKAPWVVFWDSDDIGNPIEIAQAISKVKVDCKVIIGAYQVQSVLDNSRSKLIRPYRNLNTLIVNPGLWRFIFWREFIGEVRFPNTSMGEDQVFLSRLNLKKDDVYFVDRLFYTYFIGSGSQLTKRQDVVLELESSLVYIQEIIRNDAKIENYIYIINARLILTAWKQGVYSNMEFLKQLSGGARLPLRKRICWILAFFKVITFLFLSLRKNKI